MKILIIGSGIAGMSAAITAADGGADVLLYSHTQPSYSQSVMAEGGINAALNTKGENDSPEIHKEDTIKAGHWLADEKAVDDLTKNAPELVKQLGKRGVVFNRDENCNIDLRPFGGQSKTRTAYAKSGIGRHIIAGLSGELRKRIATRIISLESTKDFVSPVLNNSQRVIGAIFRDTTTGDLEAVSADAVIACSGGLSGLFSYSTGSVTNDGIVTASLFTAGAKLANLEMIQYHPTTIVTPSKQMLLSEAARGEGGRLFTIKDGKRWYFMDEWYPEKGSLMPRDVVSHAIFKITHELKLGLNEGNTVGLDLTNLPDEKYSNKLKEICNKTITYLGINPKTDYIPVTPGIHYFMGGLYVDRFHRTTIPGLYAAGECACQYHGANRLGGNSTLGALYGGKRAATTAIDECKISIGHREFLDAADIALSIAKKKIKANLSLKKKEELRDLLSAYLGIIRNEKELLEGLEKLKTFETDNTSDNIYLAKAILLSALERKESRGAHSRSDYPETIEAFRKTTVSSFSNNEISITFEEIGREFA